MTFSAPVRARFSVVTAFTMSAVMLLGNVGYQYLDAATIRDNILPRSPSVSQTVNPRDALKMARSKRDADKKAKAEMEAHAKPSLRDVKAAGKLNAEKAAEMHGAARSINYERSRCGDKIIIDPEKCYDGNSQSGDGCSSSCTVETGFQCTTGQPSTCWDSCGDAKVSSREKCDDGNGNYGDGCSEICHIEPGYACSGSPSSCTHP